MMAKRREGKEVDKLLHMLQATTGISYYMFTGNLGNGYFQGNDSHQEDNRVFFFPQDSVYDCNLALLKPAYKAKKRQS
jgi:hypothetical protein